jgi:peptidoglycan hydrolase-like protein with peptidoglycan-binding domain
MYVGLGNIQVPTPIPGNMNRMATVRATGYNYCGDLRGLQQILAELGWYKGAVDNIFGPGTKRAAEAAAREYGVPFTKGGTINNDFCQAVMDAWVALNAPRPAPRKPAPPAPAPAPAPRRDSAPSSQPRSGTTPPQKTSTQKSPSGKSSNGGSSNGGITEWWNSQEKNTQIAIGLGAVGVVGLGVYLLATPKKSSI